MDFARHLEAVPLTKEETDHLQVIYTQRFRVFCAGYSFLVGYGLYNTLGRYSTLTREQLSERAGESIDYEVFDYAITRFDMFYILLFFFGGLIVISGIITFYKKVYPFKKDIRSGKKEIVGYKIVNKLYFGTTKEYFLSFSDPRYLHHEVDAETYDSFNIGDEVKVHRGMYSKPVFEKDGRFTL